MNTNVSVNKRNNDLLDLVKFILSFIIVAIHSQLLDPYLYPWLRLAVPLFFIISSYLFFTKINTCTLNRERLLLLKGFVLRNLKLYAFWFVVLFPVNIFTRGWFDDGFFNGIVKILQGLLFGSTFVASWFIMALIIGVAIVFFASKKMSNSALITIGAILYILICMRSSYMFLFADFPIGLLEAIVKYESIVNAPINSFPAGLFWIVCGKLFADGAFAKFKIKESSIILGISAGLLLTEWLLLKHFSGNFNKDFYIMLAPCAIAIFNILIQLKPINLKYSREMRKISVIVYASHGTVIPLLNKLLEVTVGSMPATAKSIVVFIGTLAICISIAILILNLERTKYLTWLKYSH